MSILLFALITLSFRDPQGTTFVGATCDLSLPMLSNPRLKSTFGFHISVLKFYCYVSNRIYSGLGGVARIVVAVAVAFVVGVVSAAGIAVVLVLLVE